MGGVVEKERGKREKGRGAAGKVLGRGAGWKVFVGGGGIYY